MTKDEELLDSKNKIKKLEDEILELKKKAKEEKKKKSTLSTMMSTTGHKDNDISSQLQYLNNMGTIRDLQGLGLEWDNKTKAPKKFHKSKSVEFDNQNIKNDIGIGKVAPWRQTLKRGSQLDCLDEGQLWWTARVMNVDKDNDTLTIQYIFFFLFIYFLLILILLK